MATRNGKYKITTLVTIIVALLSCLSINLTWAKFTSTIEEDINTPTANFIVELKHDEANENLYMTPSASGSFVAFEFTVSNTAEEYVSDINQNYYTGVLIPTQCVVDISQSNLDISLIPMLVVTNDMTSSMNEIAQYITAGNIPEGVKFANFQDFEIVDVDGTLENGGNILDYDYLTFTWLYDSDSDQIYGDMSNVMETPQEGYPIAFKFTKQNKETLRFFVVFFVAGTLPVGKTINFAGMQVVVYSEQVE